MEDHLVQQCREVHSGISRLVGGTVLNWRARGSGQLSAVVRRRKRSVARLLGAGKGSQARQGGGGSLVPALGPTAQRSQLDGSSLVGSCRTVSNRVVRSRLALRGLGGTGRGEGSSSLRPRAVLSAVHLARRMGEATRIDRRERSLGLRERVLLLLLLLVVVIAISAFIDGTTGQVSTTVVLALAAVLAAVPPVLDSIVTASRQTTSNLSPTLTKLTDEALNGSTLLGGDGLMAERGLEVLVKSLSALLGGSGAKSLSNADPVQGAMSADKAHEVAVFMVGPRSSAMLWWLRLHCWLCVCEVDVECRSRARFIAGTNPIGRFPIQQTMREEGQTDERARKNCSIYSRMFGNRVLCGRPCLLETSKIMMFKFVGCGWKNKSRWGRDVSVYTAGCILCRWAKYS